MSQLLAGHPGMPWARERLHCGARSEKGYTYFPKTGLIYEGRWSDMDAAWHGAHPAARVVPAKKIRPGSAPEMDVVISCNGKDVPVLDILEGSHTAAGCRHGWPDLEMMRLLPDIPAMPLDYKHDMFDMAVLGGTREECRPRQAHKAYGVGEDPTPDYRVRFDTRTCRVRVPLPDGVYRHMYDDPSVTGRIWNARGIEHGPAMLRALDDAERVGPVGRPRTAENGRPYLEITPEELGGIISRIRSPGNIRVLMGFETCYQYMEGCGRDTGLLDAYRGWCPLPGVPNATVLTSPMVDRHAPRSIYVVNRQYGALYGQGPVFIRIDAGGLLVEESFQYVMVDSHIRRYGDLPDGPTALRIDAGVIPK